MSYAPDDIVYSIVCNVHTTTYNVHTIVFTGKYIFGKTKTLGEQKEVITDESRGISQLFVAQTWAVPSLRL